jgi:hypothetical protein
MRAGFAPELYGKPITEEDILATKVEEKNGIPYYLWCGGLLGTRE